MRLANSVSVVRKCDMLSSLQIMWNGISVVPASGGGHRGCRVRSAERGLGLSLSVI